jgi:hypothetical protein
MPINDIKHDLNYYLFDKETIITIQPNKTRIFRKINKNDFKFWVVSPEI